MLLHTVGCKHKFYRHWETKKVCVSLYCNIYLVVLSLCCYIYFIVIFALLQYLLYWDGLELKCNIIKVCLDMLLHFYLLSN